MKEREREIKGGRGRMNIKIEEKGDTCTCT